LKRFGKIFECGKYEKKIESIKHELNAKENWQQYKKIIDLKKKIKI